MLNLLYASKTEQNKDLITTGIYYFTLRTKVFINIQHGPTKFPQCYQVVHSSPQ